MKKATLFSSLISLLLVATLLLVGCGKEPGYTVLGDVVLEDCILSIHYDDPNIRRLYCYTLRGFLESPNGFDADSRLYHTTVSGTELKENKQFLALLKMADKQDLPPVQDITNYWEEIYPCIYYSLADQNGEMLFDVTFGLGSGVYFNGEKVPYDKLFYTSVEPYLTEPHWEK